MTLLFYYKTVSLYDKFYFFTGCIIAHVCFNSLGWESVHKRDNQAGKHPEVNKVCCYVTNFNDSVFNSNAFSRSIADLYDYICIDDEIRKFKSNL